MPIGKYGSLTKSDARAVNKKDVVNRLLSIQQVDAGLFVDLIATLIEFILDGSKKSQDAQIICEAKLDVLYDMLRMSQPDSLASAPTVRELLLLVQNSGIITRTIPTTFRDFLRTLDTSTLQFIAHSNELRQFLGRAGVTVPRGANDRSEAYDLVKAWITGQGAEIIQGYLGNLAPFTYDAEFVGQIARDIIATDAIKAGTDIATMLAPTINEIFISTGETGVAGRSEFYKNFLTTHGKLLPSVFRSGDQARIQSAVRERNGGALFMPSANIVKYLIGIHQGVFAHHVQHNGFFNAAHGDLVKIESFRTGSMNADDDLEVISNYAVHTRDGETGAVGGQFAVLSIEDKIGVTVSGTTIRPNLKSSKLNLLRGGLRSR